MEPTFTLYIGPNYIHPPVWTPLGYAAAPLEEGCRRRRSGDNNLAAQCGELTVTATTAWAARDSVCVPSGAGTLK